MSWPDDNLPRFVVASVTGMVIDPAVSGGKGRGGTDPYPSCSAVLDRAYAHRVVREFLPTGTRSGLKIMSSATCKRLADEFCATLNASDKAGLMDEQDAETEAA